MIVRILKFSGRILFKIFGGKCSSYIENSFRRSMPYDSRVNSTK